MKRQESVSKIIETVLNGVGLAMAVAVVVTNILGIMDPNTQITLLGIGLFALALNSLDKDRE